jgi:hypothetical protein
VLGTLHDRDDPRGYTAIDILLGLTVGLAIALGLYVTGHRQLHGLHAGVIGVAANYLACWVSHVVRRPRPGTPRRTVESAR